MRGNLNIEFKKRLLYSYVFSVLSYDYKSWTLKKESCRRIDVFKLWCYRRMLKISWKEKITNKKVVIRIEKKDEFLQQYINTQASICWPCYERFG